MFLAQSGRWRAAALQLGLLAATFVGIDVLAYLFLPKPHAAYFIAYRQSPLAADALRDIERYYRAHPDRGHDIAPGAKGWHTAQMLRYPVWANALGCFDEEHPVLPRGYVYFGGDSFTWGFSPYETKYATHFEHATGVPTLKCGVISSGQRAQLAKFKEIVARVGHMPGHVILNYCVNDVSDDYLYPHTTVVSDLLVNAVFVDDDLRGHRLDLALLERETARRLAEIDQRKQAVTAPLRDVLKRYSLTSNVLASLLEPRGRAPGAMSGILVDGRRLEPPSVLVDHYERDGRLDYSHPLADANKQALAQWREHARQNGYRLSVMLIPPRHLYDNVRYYDGVRAYLDRLGIDHLDLAAEFKRLGTHVNTAYWLQDAHLTPDGNRIAGEALVRRWGSRPQEHGAARP